MNNIEILKGDVTDQLRTLESNSVDAIITDPPYNLGMDEWDKWKTNQHFREWCHEWGKEAYRILKPSGTIFSFSSGRTYHWMAIALEEAGFATLDMIEWVYWGTMPRGKRLKSCHEPIYVGVKGSFSGFNVDENRVPLDKKSRTKLESVLLPNMPEGKHPGRGAYSGETDTKKYGKSIDDMPYQMDERGRHPFNAVTTTITEALYPSNILDIKKPRGSESIKGHQTQKPVSLMRWLIELSTQPGDVVLDCFGGTGTTAVAAIESNRRCILIEREEEYIRIINDRLA